MAQLKGDETRRVKLPHVDFFCKRDTFPHFDASIVIHTTF